MKEYLSGWTIKPKESQSSNDAIMLSTNFWNVSPTV